MNTPLIGQRRPRILLGTPSSFQILTITAHFIDQVREDLRANGFQVGRQPSEGSMVERNQNALVRKAVEEHADVMLLIDSDMSGDPTIARCMYHVLRTRGCDVLCCDYRQRPPPHGMGGLKLDGTRNRGDETGVEEMTFMPSGMMMIQRRVFTTVPYPWFFNEYNDCDENFNGNDFNFCRKARAAGFRVWCHHDLSDLIQHNVVVGLCRKMQATVEVPA